MLARAFELAQIAFKGVDGKMRKDSVANELSTNLRLVDERIGLALSDAELCDVVLDVTLIVISVIGVVELFAA